jgi:iduronate 2-sulfatase
MSPLLTTLLLLLLTSTLTAAPSQNILFIAIDDLGNVLGRTRPPGLATPNLDRLHARGLFFERAYCQIPLCNPSRASVLTGLRPDTTQVYDLDRHFRDTLPNAITLPQLFRQSGGTAHRIGKIYHYDVPSGIGTNGLDDPPSWDTVLNPKGRDVTDEPLITNPTPEKPISAALSWLAADGTDAEQTDGIIARESAQLLASLAKQKRPFFLATGFFRPHTPFVAPIAYFKTHPLNQIHLPTFALTERQNLPLAALPHNCFTPGYDLPELTLRQALQAYHASVAFVDAQLGLLLDALDQNHLWPTTTVVLWSDHGYHLGEHGLWQKRTLFDESARAPLLIAAPQIPETQRGKTCQRIVEFIDLFPTLCHLANLPPPPALEGTSLHPLLENPDAPWTRPAFTQILRLARTPETLTTPLPDLPQIMGRAITTERHRYIEWNNGHNGIELYDNSSDPHEQTNLATDPSSANLIQHLRSLFPKTLRAHPPTSPANPKRL